MYFIVAPVMATARHFEHVVAAAAEVPPLSGSLIAVAGTAALTVSASVAAAVKAHDVQASVVSFL